MRILLVEDDVRRERLFRDWVLPEDRIVWARSAGQALGILARDRGHVYDALLLDHDLEKQPITDADREINGTTVVHAIRAFVDPSVPILVHSTNLRDGPEMVRVLAASGFQFVERIPFYRLDAAQLRTWLDDFR